MSISTGSVDVMTEIAAVLRMTYGRDAWHVLMQPEVRLMGESVVPHVAAWRRDRLPSLPATGAIDVVPDWACEVIRREVAQWITRMDLYRRAGVAWLWRVFADDGVLESFENIGPHWRMEGVHGDDVARIAPFTAIAFECDRMFGRLPLALR